MTKVAEGIDETGAPTPARRRPRWPWTSAASPWARDLILYLFGTPGQDRFWFMWDDLVRGAIGAVVLVDTRRLADCFPAVDYFETQGVPFIVAVNLFHGKQQHSLEDVREALTVPEDVPMVTTDARDRAATKMALLELVQHALVRASAAATS